MARKTVTIIYNASISVLKFRSQVIAALQDAGYDVAVLAPRDGTSPDFAKLGITHYPITMSQYGMHPFKELRSIREMRAILEEIRPVATLNYTIKPNIFGTLAAQQAGVPVLANIAGAGRAFSGNNLLLRWLVIGLYHRALRHAHTVFFQNGDDMEIFAKARLVTEAQCVRIPGSGVDLKRFRPSPVPTAPLRFLFIGRLLKEKGITEFLTAATELLKNPAFKDVGFDIVGDHDDDRSSIAKDTLDTFLQTPQITYHGPVKPTEIDGFIQRAACVVLPSYYGEGVPRVLLEACASGRPIITTDNVGCRDVVEPGVNGWKVPPRNVSALKSAFEEFANMPSEARAALGQAARRTAEDRFDEQFVIDAYLERLSLL